jgi:acyl carrier protein
VALHKRYGISLSGDAEEVRRHFASVSSLAVMIASHRTK